MAKPKEEVETVKPEPVVAPVPAVSEAEAPAVRHVFVLMKNHGIHTDGRKSEFFAAGTEFDAEKDATTITRLARSGAILEQR